MSHFNRVSVGVHSPTGGDFMLLQLQLFGETPSTVVGKSSSLLIGSPPGIVSHPALAVLCKGVPTLRGFTVTFEGMFCYFCFISELI